MIELKTLENAGIEELLEVFNSAFSDYFVPFKLNREQLVQKMNSENVIPAYSAGAYENGKLIGFILHSSKITGNKIELYNSGTGVIPGKRGFGLTHKMYQFILPLLEAQQADNITLEVLENNIQAIKSYEKTGFESKRHLSCFKGKISWQKNGMDVREIKSYDWNVFSSFWDFSPAWQNSVEVMERLTHANILISAYTNNQLTGYAIYNPVSKRVSQFGVNKIHRNKLTGKSLFNYIAEKYDDNVSIINVDSASKPAVHFLKGLGLENHINQIEMVLNLKKPS